MGNLMRIIEKYSIVIPVLFLFTLLLFAFFPHFFTATGPNDNHLRNSRPNNGKNLYKLKNDNPVDIKVDSLLIVFKENRILIAKDLVLKKNSELEGEFYMKDLKISPNIGKIQIRLFTNSNKRVKVYFNGNDKYFYLRKYKNYLKSDINYNIFLNKGSSRFLNRFNEKSFLGTDKYGRDTWSRLVYGTVIIVQIVILSLLISIPIGIIFGLIHGYYNNWLSKIIGVLVNLANSIPIYLLTMLIVAYYSQKLMIVVVAFSLVQWVEIEKIMYQKIVLLKENDFILSAKSFGKSNFNIMFSELLVLCIPEIIIAAIFLAKKIILIEASLSFLGYSVEIPNASWGSIVAEARENMMSGSQKWLIIPSTVMIIFTAYSLNSVGNFLRERISNND